MKDIKLQDLNPYNIVHSREENFDARSKAIKSFKAKADAKRTFPEKFADALTKKFGSIAFLTINAIWFFTWIVINTNLTSIKPFDPFPFGLLTMIVSLEAIFLAIIVLISQNREARVAELREEIELQIDTVTEGELTKLISLVVILLEKQGVNMDNDPELAKMLKPINSEKMERDLEKELN